MQGVFFLAILFVQLAVRSDADEFYVRRGKVFERSNTYVEEVLWKKF